MRIVRNKYLYPWFFFVVWLYTSSKTRWVGPISWMPWKLLEWYAINYFPNEIQQHKIAESIHQIQFISWSRVRDELPTQFGSLPFQSGGLSVSEAQAPLGGLWSRCEPPTQSSGGSNLIRLNSETLFFSNEKSFWIEKKNRIGLDLCEAIFFSRQNKHLGFIFGQFLFTIPG